MPTRTYTVRGRVQGVGFRYFTARAAAAFGITGQVRNVEDGSVEIVARGDESSLRSFREQIEIGPAHARVDHVDVMDVQDQEFERFTTVG